MAGYYNRRGLVKLIRAAAAPKPETMPSYEIRVSVRQADADQEQEAAIILFDRYLEVRVWFGKLLE